MRLSTLWSIIHAWNANRKHRQCMVCIPQDDRLDTHSIAIDFALAAAHGRLIPHRVAVEHFKTPEVWFDTRTTPPTLSATEPQ